MKRKTVLLGILVLTALTTLATCATGGGGSANERYFTTGPAHTGMRGVTITGYTGRATDVIIPSRIGGWPVLYVGTGAFQESGITSVRVPEGVRVIGARAFGRNPELTSVTLPSSLEHIGELAFAQNPQLAVIAIPIGATFSNINAFDNTTEVRLFGSPPPGTRSARAPVPILNDQGMIVTHRQTTDAWGDTSTVENEIWPGTRWRSISHAHGGDGFSTTGNTSATWGVMQDGSLWIIEGFGPLAFSGWGQGRNRQRIGQDYDWVSVSLSVMRNVNHHAITHAATIRADGTLWVADRNRGSVNGLVRLGSDTNWRSVDGLIATKTDGTRWLWPGRGGNTLDLRGGVIRDDGGGRLNGGGPVRMR